MRSRQRRHPEINPRAIDRHASAASLRAQAIGDVHLRHDLDPRHQWNGYRLGKNHDFSQDSIDAVSNRHAVLTSLEVNVTRTPRDSLRDDVVDELDDRPFNSLLHVIHGVVGLFEHRLSRRCAGAIEHPRNTLDWRIHLFDALHDSRRRSERHPDRAAGRESERLFAIQVVRIRCRDVERCLRDREREYAVPPGEALGDSVTRIGADDQVSRDFEVGANSQRVEDVLVGREARRDRGFPPARPHSVLERLHRALTHELAKNGKKPAVADYRSDYGCHIASYDERASTRWAKQLSRHQPRTRLPISTSCYLFP